MKILVIGEQCNDKFIYGETKRLSPEAPVPVFLPKYTKTNNGMGGNVVANITSMFNHDVEVSQIHQMCIITKTRYVDEKTNHMFIRVDEGEENIVPLAVDENIMKQIQEADAVIVSDYGKGFLTNATLKLIGENSKFSVIDTKRNIEYDFIQYFDFIKVNEEEFNKNEKILSEYINKVIITLGKNGVLYGNKKISSPAPKETIDVSGAGDTFTAAFTVQYMKSKNLADSIYHANYMASIVVSKRGVAVP